MHSLIRAHATFSHHSFHAYFQRQSVRISNKNSKIYSCKLPATLGAHWPLGTSPALCAHRCTWTCTSKTWPCFKLTKSWATQVNITVTSSGCLQKQYWGSSRSKTKEKWRIKSCYGVITAGNKTKMASSGTHKHIKVVLSSYPDWCTSIQQEKIKLVTMFQHKTHLNAWVKRPTSSLSLTALDCLLVVKNTYISFVISFQLISIIN